MFGHTLQMYQPFDIITSSMSVSLDVEFTDLRAVETKFMVIKKHQNIKQTKAGISLVINLILTVIQD